ncbi:MAG TPA: PQQ-dependent sugar dehydrogenase [Vineibacter sp.]|nr:PQQ-dependent sugar dehydrogenase [Vineibacter sp.]
MNRRGFVLGAAAGATTVAMPAILRAQGKVFRSQKESYRFVTLSRDLEQPWGMQFLPDGRLLITERPGRLRVFADGKLERRPLSGVPEVWSNAQGGLLDICLHPNFARNNTLYLSYAAPVQGGGLTRLARARLADDGLRDLKPLLDATPPNPSDIHFGSRIAFDRAGLLYMTSGERGERPSSQRLDVMTGKMFRLRDDGSVPRDNPFVGRAGARPEIYSYGHRNPQGLTMHPDTGRMWSVEHGPRGGDELNLLKPGANYGWPLATHGTEYFGPRISPHTSLPGMEDPVKQWTPSISPSGLLVYTGDAFPGWRGSFFTGALSAFALFRLEIEGERYVGEERLVPDTLPYIRDVRQGPDGALYLCTNADRGGLYRIEPT